jgi:formamidopyrimidine-DNA glycosylase
MPELPDLQVFSANLNKMIKNKMVAEVTVPVTKKLNVSVAVLKKGIEGQKVKQVIRNGKELLIQFRNGNEIALHLMLHGNLYLVEQIREYKHTIFELLFDDDTGLALTDWQKAAVVTFNPEPKEAPDALSDKITVSYIKRALNKKADEILWDARISPFSISAKIPDDPVKALTKSIKKVLHNAEKQIKKTNPDIITGEVRDFLLIHNAHKHESPSGAEIMQKTTGGRKTYYTSEQDLYK